MKRWLWMAVLLVMLPKTGVELGSLIPTAVLRIQTENRQIILTTDTGTEGRGETLHAAINDMIKSAPGTLLIDTVEILILDEQSMIMLPELKELLRSSVRVCRSEEELPLEEAQVYLRTHKPNKTLKDDTKYQILHYKERFRLEQ